MKWVKRTREPSRGPRLAARTICVSLAAVASVGMVACASSDDKLSKSKLAAKADAICKKATTDVAKIKAPASVGDPVVAAKYFNQVAPIAQKETDDLADLKPADDVKDDWQAVVDKQKEGNDFLKTIRDKAEAKDRSGLRDLQKAPAIVQEFAAAAKKIGAVDCAAGLTG